ncbi:MAG: VOC family protein [Nitrospirae bacterium]|nr:VOC family protein [Nitrospirota bacterium]
MPVTTPVIVHTEIAADDVERSRKFYAELFGWKFEKMEGTCCEGGPSEYLLYTTKDDKGNVAFCVGLMNRMHPEHHITSYIGVDSIDEYAKKVESLGGKIIVPKAPVPGVGYFAVFMDTENNPLGLWQDDENAK